MTHEGALTGFNTQQNIHVCLCLQNVRPLIIGFLVNVKEGALVLLTPSGEVPDLPSRFTKRYAIRHLDIGDVQDEYMVQCTA